MSVQTYWRLLWSSSCFVADTLYSVWGVGGCHSHQLLFGRHSWRCSIPVMLQTSNFTNRHWPLRQSCKDGSWGHVPWQHLMQQWLSDLQTNCRTWTTITDLFINPVRTAAKVTFTETPGPVTWQLGSPSHTSYLFVLAYRWCVLYINPCKFVNKSVLCVTRVSLLLLAHASLRAS